MESKELLDPEGSSGPPSDQQVRARQAWDAELASTEVAAARDHSQAKEKVLERISKTDDVQAVWASVFGSGLEVPYIEARFGRTTASAAVIPQMSGAGGASDAPAKPIEAPRQFPAPAGREDRAEPQADAGDGSDSSASDGGGQAYAGLRRAMERARQGGAPVRVLHYGASHTVAGIEARKLETLLENHAPVDYFRKAKNGVSALYPLQHKQEWLEQAIGETNPDLVMIEFGNNEAAGRINREKYRQKFEELVLEIKSRAPNASIFVMGPTDGCSIVGANKGKLLPGLTEVIEVQKEIAARHGLDYFDVREAMGGPGSIYQWRERGLASSDLLHFNKSGYEALGRMRYEHLMKRLGT